MVVWEKDQPYFISDDNKGDCILLNFGLGYVDDIEVASERHFVFCKKMNQDGRRKLTKICHMDSYIGTWSMNWLKK